MSKPNRLAEERAKSRLTQAEVAQILGCAPATVARHESGERSMSAEQIKAYADLYKVPQHALFVDLDSD